MQEEIKWGKDTIFILSPDDKVNKFKGIIFKVVVGYVESDYNFISEIVKTIDKLKYENRKVYEISIKHHTFTFELLELFNELQ